MRAQKGELLERLSSARNFSNMDDEDNYSAASKAVRQVGAVVPSGICTLPLDAPPPCFLSSKEYVTGSSVHSPELPLENVATFYSLVYDLSLPLPHQVNRKLSSHQATSDGNNKSVIASI